MENKPQNVFDKLDSIEASQSVTKAQNQQILDLLNEINNKQPVKQNVEVVPQSQIKVSNQDILKKFIRSSKKEHIWFGSTKDFNKSKMIVYGLSIALIIVGILSTIFTSVALKMYSTFTFFENIWLIFACILFSYSVNAKKRMLDTDLKDHSQTIFYQDLDGTWRDTNKEKKRFRWFRRISYIAVLANIIVIWIQSKGAIAIMATLFELFFAGITVGIFFAYIYLFSMYGNFILFTGNNVSNTETVTLIFDVFGNALAPYEDYKEKFKDYL